MLIIIRNKNGISFVKQIYFKKVKVFMLKLRLKSTTYEGGIKQFISI